MSLIRIDHDPSVRNLNIFGAIWLVFFASVGWMVLRNGGSVLGASAVGALAILVPLIGWFVPKFMRLAFLGLAYVAFPIGFVVSFLIMMVVYYLVLSPIGLMMKLVGYDPMQRTLDRDAPSYWIARQANDRLDTYFRQF